MAITVASLTTRAQTILQDSTGIRWPVLELVDWVNDAQREVVMLLPNAGSVTENFVLDIANTLQRLPTGAIQFLRAIRVVGGRALRAADRDILDSQLPDWHQTTAATPVHYVHDPIDPTVFYIYPRPTAAASVELVYSKAPTLANQGGNLSIPDVYANAVLDYMLYRAYSKDAEATANRELADAAYSRFVTALGMKAAASMAGAYQTPVQRASAVGS